ncbi:hypothetical protein [Mesorhizobium sp. M0578]|uniref:hypothetical protein n=1 Tax=unclassified Mesorhizobium TaxID=325217 RepID=UPI003338F60E
MLLLIAAPQQQPDPGQSHAHQPLHRIVESLAGGFYNKHQGHQIKQEFVNCLADCFRPTVELIQRNTRLINGIRAGGIDQRLDPLETVQLRNPFNGQVRTPFSAEDSKRKPLVMVVSQV